MERTLIIDYAIRYLERTKEDCKEQVKKFTEEDQYNSARFNLDRISAIENEILQLQVLYEKADK